MAKKYIVRLTDEERETLSQLIKKARVCSQKARRARVLLKADANGPGWTDAQIARPSIAACGRWNSSVSAWWHTHHNAHQREVDWQFKVDDARLKLKSIYPKLQV